MGNIGMSFYIINKITEDNSLVFESNFEANEILLEPEVITEITVDIKGMVNAPGVYVMNSSAIINDLINIAGGLKKDGTTSNINLSKKLTDEMVVIISSTKDLKTKNIVSSIECPDYYINGCGKENDLVGVVENSPSQTKSGKVSINTGNKEELMTLSGIGESKAMAIINYRTENGPFKELEDLMNISGIGVATFANIKENITL